MTYTYDNLSRIQTVSYPDMGTVTYAYATGNNLNQYTISTPNGVNQTRLTDAFDELTSVKSTNNSGAALWTESFGYDGMGNIKSIDRNGKRYDYTYDSLNRITQETSAAGNVNATYTYDAKGNISTIDSSEEPSSKLINQTYSYNALNQLSGYTSPTATASYTYYGDGLRASKTVNGVKTQYVYLNGRVIEELNASGNTIGRNIWGNELLYRKDAVANKAGFYSYNGHGDVVAVRDSTGAILNSYDYDIWGNVTSKFEQMSNPFKYTGEIYDDESGLIYLRARYYSPVDKRFINEDTYEGDITNPLTLNLYTYVGNNPLTRLDPTGHSWTVDLALPLTQEDKDTIALAEQETNNATDAMERAAAHQKAMDVRNKYISDANLQAAINSLQSEGIINNNLEFTEDICSGLSAIELIYAYAGTFITSNYDNYISAFSFGNSVEEGLEQFYGEIVCFTSDTVVATKDGDKLIKDIKIGDELFSENVDTGEKGFKRVTKLFINESSTIVHITIGNEEVKATPTHPFWVVGTGWKKADDLQEGDKVVLLSGNEMIVSSVYLEQLDIPVKTYNFEVEDWHTYYVSTNHVLVHNKCGPNPLGQTGSYIITFQNDGMRYIGKGSYYRAQTSAKRWSNATGNPVVSIDWEIATNSREAFKTEYKKMRDFRFGLPGSRLYNVIASPGQNYYQQDGDED